MTEPTPRPVVAIIGGGPAGLMAAEAAHAAGAQVDVYDHKGSVGRKFLIAGKGGLNLTHSEPRPGFDARYFERSAEVGRWLDAFDADALRAWARGLGVDTFVGTSGRVFPTDLKAAPLLRGWVRRLRESGVRFHVHHRWCAGFGPLLRFDAPHGPMQAHCDAAVFALGGGSWPELGSDGTWPAAFAAAGIACAPLQPSNCGFDVDWTPVFAARFAGTPLKPVVAHSAEGGLQGECVVTATGIEGSLVYALSAGLREAIARDGDTVLRLDLAPHRSLDSLVAALARPRGARSLSEHLRRSGALQPVHVGLLIEALGHPLPTDPARLAATLKALPLRLRRPRPLAEAISSAGGVRFDAFDANLMLHAHPGAFVAGEMLDWEAPTGGYLLTACMASGHLAGQAAARYARDTQAWPAAAVMSDVGHPDGGPDGAPHQRREPEPP